jgi:hypothetical protein
LPANCSTKTSVPPPNAAGRRSISASQPVSISGKTKD